MLAKYLGLFSLGVGGAIVFVYAGGARAVGSLFTPTRVSSSSSAELKDLTFNVVHGNPLEHAYQPSERLNGLVVALRKGTPKVLNLLRNEFVRSAAKDDKDYQERVLPILQREALEAFLSRMIDRDWESWPRAHLVRDGMPSPARMYVDDLLGANTELGVFLETSARMLYGLQLFIAEGRPFDGAEYLLEIQRNAETIFARRPLSLRTVPALQLVDSRVLQNPVFLEVLERERAKATRRYIFQHPETVPQNVALLKSVDPRSTFAEFHDSLEKELAYLAMRVTPDFRREYLENELRDRVLKRFEELDPGVRAASSKLFLLGAIDAVNSKKLDLAEQLLIRSVQIEKNENDQEKVANMIDHEREKERQALLEARPELREQDLSSDTDPLTSLRSAHSSLGDVVVTIVFFVSLIFIPILGMYLVFRLRSGRVRYGPPKMPPTKAPTLVAAPKPTLSPVKKVAGGKK